MRNPGASGVKLTFTLQEMPAEMAPLQVPPLPSVKSRPSTPCVTTWMAPMVVFAARLKVTARLLPVHPAGLPPGQTLQTPKFSNEKLAVTFSAAFMVTPQVELVPELAHAPPQPRNADPAEAVAVSVTVPLA